MLLAWKAGLDFILVLLSFILHHKKLNRLRFLPTVSQKSVPYNQIVCRKCYCSKKRSLFIYIEYLFVIDYVGTSELYNSEYRIVIGSVEDYLAAYRLELAVHHRLQNFSILGRFDTESQFSSDNGCYRPTFFVSFPAEFNMTLIPQHYYKLNFLST